MKIKILTEYGQDIGYGHISRCSSIFDEIANRGIEVDFIAKQTEASTCVIPHKKIYNFDWMNIDDLRDLIGPEDYIIIDSYQASEETYNSISAIAKRALFVDDFGRLDYPVGIILNPSLDISGIDYSKSRSKFILSGPKYILLREPFINRKRKNLARKVKSVLIIIGGTDPEGLIPMITKHVCLMYPYIRFNIVTNSNIIEPLDHYILLSENVYFHSNLSASEMVELILNVDFAITAAGQTVYELLATNTPFIPIQVANNQSNNIQSLKKYTPQLVAINYEKNSKDVFIDELVDAFQKGIEFCYRKEHVEKYADLIDGFGARRAIDSFLMDW